MTRVAEPIGIPASHRGNVDAQRNTSPRRRRSRRSGWWALFFLAPSGITLAIFSFAPMLVSLWTSLQKWNLIGPMQWAGLDNYAKVLTSPATGQALLNTLYFTIGYVPIVFVGGLGLALLMNSTIRGRGFFRSIYFLPVVTSWVVVALVWKWLLAPKNGVVNEILGALGLPQPGWWSDPFWAMPSVIMASAWKDLGFVMILFLAGLQAIPHTVLEAASIDGATRWQRFWRVSFPLLSPTSFLVVVLSLINGFQVFDQAYVMSYGTAATASTQTVVLQIYDLTFRYGRVGEATALSWLFFIVLILVTGLQFWGQRKWVHSE
ncbi:carbohydrate ABC transporter permease [Leifsonia aquatica]|uniref:carbohydrate ABC transporter permease n=1 Tax=Leifsonia aquatica TaxID=144185 RepID=UPI000468579B|nr:sugar ABC transporter permease [Leifsonia aquatica]